MTDEVDVAIIGGGPVGLAMANVLGCLGRRVVVLEREGEGYALPRAVAFDDEVMRFWQAIGLEEEIGQITEIGGDAQFVDGAGNVLVRWERPADITPNGWHVNYRFHQPTLEGVLRDGMGRFDHVDQKWNHDVTGLVDDGDGVTLTCANGAEIRAGYVVGCDGGRSFTRGWIGGEVEDLGFHEPWLIVDLLLQAAENDPDRKTTHYCGTPRMGSKVFVGSNRKRWEFRLNPDDDPQTIGRHENTWQILRDFISPDEAEIERTAIYTFHSVIARNWRKGRVMIAGDAAHQTPPFMGQGMCAGIRDAFNLGWKLDRALAGQGPEGMLDTYASERRPHVRQFIELTMNMGQVINRTAQTLASPAASARADGSQHMKLIRPGIGGGLSAGDATRRGRLFPQVTLGDGRRLDDVLGLRPGLVVADRIQQELRAKFSSEGVVVLEDSALREALDGARAMLIRPDRAILGAAGADIEVLLPSYWSVEP